MVFSDAWLLWIGVPLLAVWVVGWLWRDRAERRGGRATTSAVRFSSIRPLQRLKPSSTLRLRSAVRSLRVITVALLMLAMARPQTGRKETTVNTKGIDIMLAIDTSGSMQALDMDADKPITQRRDRLQVVKDVVEKFIEKRDNDQIGMVVFGTNAFTQCPLTLDHGIVSTFLSRVKIGVAGQSTAIGDAIGVAVKRLQKSKARSKIIILLTDGRNNAGTLGVKKAAEIAKTFGIKIYTVGAGGRGKAPFLVKGGLFGTQIQWQDVDLDEASLRQVAQITGGDYFRAEDAKSLEHIYERIDKLERSKITMKSYMEYDERFDLFVFPALGLLLLETLLLGTRLRKVP